MAVCQSRLQRVWRSSTVCSTPEYPALSRLPTRSQGLERGCQFSKHRRSLRRRRRIGTVGNGQYACKMLVERGKILAMFSARRQAVETALRRTFQFCGFLVQRRDGLSESATPCFCSQLFQLRAHGANLRQCFVALIHAFERTAFHSKLLLQVR